MLFSVPSASLRLILANQDLWRFFLRRQDLVKEETWQKFFGLIAWLNTGVSRSA